MQIWKGYFRNEHYDKAVEIWNADDECSLYPLMFTIDGIQFIGSDLSDFHLAEPELYEVAREKFKLFKFGQKNNYVFDLQEYTLAIEIPIQVIRNTDACLLEGILHIQYKSSSHDTGKRQSKYVCDDSVVYRDDIAVVYFALQIDKRFYEITTDTSYFDINMQELCHLLKPDYRLKCCYTCQWSDYSPYGSDDFGTMLCYRQHKTAYLKVNCKDEWFQHCERLNCICKQETAICEDYCERVQCAGYRGFVE